MTSRPDNKTLSALVHAHVGRPALVLGGAPCLVRDLARIDAWHEASNPVRISANDHAFVNGLFRPEQIDYIVACDSKYRDEKGEKRLSMEKRLRVHGRPIIAPRHWADYRVLHQIVSNSGALGCVAAWAMGCSPIVVVGIELFGGGTYWHNEQASSTGKSIGIELHLRRWTKLLSTAPHAMIRPVSGPLLRSFEEFDPSEPVADPAPEDEIAELVGGSLIEITRDVADWNGVALKAGQIIEMRPGEAGICIAHGYGKRYPSGGRHRAYDRLLG